MLIISLPSGDIALSGLEQTAAIEHTFIDCVAENNFIDCILC